LDLDTNWDENSLKYRREGKFCNCYYVGNNGSVNGFDTFCKDRVHFTNLEIFVARDTTFMTIEN
jgi:hypothetical protein